MMRQSSLALTMVLAVAAALPGTAAALPPDIRIEEGRERYVYEFSDQYCYFKYEYSFISGSERFEERGDCRGIERFPRFDPPGRGPARSPRGVAVGPRPLPPAPAPEHCGSDLLKAAALAGIVLTPEGGSPGRNAARAALTGALLSSVLGPELHRRLGDGDRRCIGAALDHVDPGRLVRMSNQDTGLDYALRPLGWVDRGGRRTCRRFEARFSDGPWREGIACREGSDRWELVELL